MAAAARDWKFWVETGSSGNSAPGSGTAHKQVGNTMVKMRKWPRPLEKKILDGGISAAGPERLCLLHTREQGAGAGWCMVCVYVCMRYNGNELGPRRKTKLAQ